MKRLLCFIAFLGITISSIWGQSTWMVNGSFSYFNTSSTPMDVVKVVLIQGAYRVDSVMTDANGHYAFAAVANGTYKVITYITKPWNSVNATDALKIQRHFAGLEIITEPVKLQAADVNLSNSVNATDAVKIKRRFSGLDNYFDRGDWTIAQPTIGGDTIIVNGANVIQDFYMLCVGDVNGSNIPSPTQEIPVAITTAITNIRMSSATTGGYVFSDGGVTVTSRGVCWSTSANPTITDNHTSDGTGTGTFVSNLTGLTANTMYFIRAYATNSVGTSYGNELTLTTLTEPCAGVTSVTYSGQTYNTIAIGTQCWMAQNLNIGTRIDSLQDQTNNQIIEKYCYRDIESNCDIYGGLYQWNEAMQYSTMEGTQGICPGGWHIITSNDWGVLRNHVGSDATGGKLKSVGTLEGSSGLWYSPNTGATNESGFSGLPGGYRTNSGTFQQLGYEGGWWQSNGSPTLNGGHELVEYNTAINFGGGTPVAFGRSVRCIKD